MARHRSFSSEFKRQIAKEFLDSRADLNQLARGFNVAAVALANKNARIIWALLTRGDNYGPVSLPTQAIRQLDQTLLIGGTRLAIVAEDGQKACGFPSGPGA